jgi:predicted nucleotidyltransferase
MMQTDKISPSSLARAQIIAKLKQCESEIRQLGVDRLFLFGSVARDEAKSDSDIDLFFDYQRGRFGVFELMEVKERVADLLGRKVDIMTRDSLHKTLRPRIEAESVAVF